MPSGALQRGRPHCILRFSDISNVAALCVFPNFVVPARQGLGRCGVRLAVCHQLLPTSQTFLEVKMLETEMAVRMGADEIDIVIPVGIFLERDYDAVINELRTSGSCRQGNTKSDT